MKVKKREPENTQQSGKRSRSFNEDNGRNPAKTRLDDLTSVEIAGLLKISSEDDIDLYLNHPRVKEYPFYGNLISYLIGQASTFFPPSSLKDFSLCLPDQSCTRNKVPKPLSIRSLHGIDNFPHKYHCIISP